MKDYTDKEQSDMILAMRNDVRKQHKDVRANNNVIATLWDFLYNVRPDLVNGKTGTTSSKKRRRTAADDEFRPTPVKSLGATAPATRSRAIKG